MLNQFNPIHVYTSETALYDKCISCGKELRPRWNSNSYTIYNIGNRALCRSCFVQYCRNLGMSREKINEILEYGGN